MLLDLITSATIGSLMGLLAHAKRNKTIKKPRNTKRTFDPGYLTDMGYGTVAAVATVIVADPSSMERLILTSLLAGFFADGAMAKLEATNLLNNNEQFKNNQEQLNEKLPAPKKSTKSEDKEE
ncbi:DUF4257 domain-containing protein [Cytobacillus purgationiresistens]|uniref:Exosome complex RNA-binding protein Rrp42 (RNase PH superfamily) n=1 Tax=Cytobacillus purgationiresistens TaxID=863449 RepID=A0ABU0AQ10_9BACI|nr:DUF4257 domain-containing protein [Cytobacillus purgationiresistens]MDQ0273373.1 exosome complex RNA-binding protein Rrp42 (RNase PH superfamily) [Cytobacillus purgationiresistens]